MAFYVPMIASALIPFENSFMKGVFTIITALWLLVCFTAWFWIVGHSLFKEFGSSTNFAFRLFKVCLVVPITMIVFIVFLVGITLITPDQFANIPVYNILNRLQAIGIFSLIYCAHFVAKYLKSVENNKISSFAEYVPTFILLWIFPVGIFFVQNRINKIFEQA